MLERVGITTDGKAIVAGVFAYYDTYGLPLEDTLEKLKANNLVCSWLDFRRDALKAGWHKERMYSIIAAAVEEVYGKEHADSVMERFERYESLLAQKAI